jgi:isochorismate synthase
MRQDSVLVGGFAFGSAPRPGESLPNAALWLPEHLWIREPGGPMREYVHAWTQDGAAHPLPTKAPASTHDGRDWSREEWREAVESALQLIEESVLEKVVLARSREIVGARAWDPAMIFDALRSAFPECFHYYCDDGDGRVFLGASPERLVSLRDGRVAADAMAGTARRDPRDPDDGVASHTLRSDRKERLEHAVVVREILASLRGRSVDAIAPAEPEVARFRHLLHLRTRIQGSAPSGTHVLDLVSSLHPTPAVAGTPAEPALAFLLAREPRARGWYAGPIGWMDGAGNGEFTVGLRSALLQGNRALLLAGAGIVSGSDPDREWNECESKMAFLEEILTRG